MSRFGLTQDQYKLVEQIVITPLKKFNATVFVFGSRAKGNQHPFSDLDLLFKESTQQTVPENVISSIKETAEESHLPIKIDLVNDKNLAASYRDSVEKNCVVWPESL